MRHVIIGAGPAGVVAAETLRGLDSQSEILLIGDEPEPPYSRMAIPYCLIDMIKDLIDKGFLNVNHAVAKSDFARAHRISSRIAQQQAS